MRINLLFVCLKTPISESSVLMFVEHNLIKNIKIFTLAFTLTVVLIQLSRLISPLAVIHSNYIFLAWMPLCVMLSILFIFGWRGVVPILCGMFCTNLWNLHLSFLQTAVMIGSQAFCSPVCLCNITLAIGDALALWIDQPIRLATSVLAWFGGADWHQMQHVSCGKFL